MVTMLTNQLSSKYAQALYELAKAEDRLEETREELVTVSETIAGHRELAILMYNPLVPVQAKKETIKTVLGDEMSGLVCKFLWLLLDKRRETLLSGIVTEYQKLINQGQNVLEAEVITALPLSVIEKQVLSDKLRKVTGKRILLKVCIDKNIIGGIIVKIGDKLIDGSVARQIKTLEAALMEDL